MKPVQAVGHRVYSEGAKDSHGNPLKTWADPVDLHVFSIAPRYSREPEPDRDETLVGLRLLAPPETVVGPHDRIVVGGRTYDVEGEPADWTMGPFGWAPGISIDLKITEG